jgi:hypothetical protein
MPPSPCPPASCRGQFGLYLYYVGVAYILKVMSPPLAQVSEGVKDSE